MEALLEGKSALVTGAARGIGFACAKALCRAGAAVVLLDVLSREAEEAAAAISGDGGKAAVVVADVTETARLRSAVGEAEARFGGIDILVNNAGISPEAPTDAITEEQWDRVMQVNLKSVFFVTQMTLPGMLGRGRGAIVNVSSVVARSGGINSTMDYTASKGGVLVLTRSLARELGPRGIRVNAVAPGPVMTPMIAHWPRTKLDDLVSRIPLRRLGEADDVANAVVFLASPWADYLTGVAIDVAGGLFMS